MITSRSKRWMALSFGVVLLIGTLANAQGKLATTSQTETASFSRPQTETEPSPEVARKPAAVSDQYVIASDDLLAINVWKEPELSRTVPVRPDGRITLPLIGDVMAKGLTPLQLQANLSKQLAAYITSPSVSVIVQEVKGHQFNIMGEVQRPGAYSLIKPTTVLDAIAVAGGFKDFAKTKKIYVLRVDSTGKAQRLPFNYKQVIKGEQLTQNIVLMPNDTIVVP